MDVINLLLMARLLDAAYETDPIKQKVLFESLGISWINYFSTAQCSITLAEWNNRQIVVIPGTHFTENTKPLEILDDLRGGSISLGYGNAFDGDYTPFVPVWRRAQVQIVTSMPLIIGHSLGGCRALLSPALGAPTGSEIIAFGAPPAGNPQLWATLYRCRKPPTIIINEEDFAPTFALDRIEGWCQPDAPYLWLHDGAISEVDKLPGGVSIEDHMTSGSSGYIASLERIVQCQPAT